MPPMKERIHASILGVAMLALTACSGHEGTSSTQASAFKYPDGSPHPVTPWGDPDLQGNWPIMHLFATTTGAGILELGKRAAFREVQQTRSGRSENAVRGPAR